MGSTASIYHINHIPEDEEEEKNEIKEGYN